MTTKVMANEQLWLKLAQLTHGLVEIKDETGEFLLKLEDGRVIDTKGWFGWEVS